MVRIISESYVRDKGHAEMTIRWDFDNDNDFFIIEKIKDLLAEQKQCVNCIHYQSDGMFCGYESHSCEIHGNIEAFDHPHYDGDGSKCEDYVRL